MEKRICRVCNLEKDLEKFSSYVKKDTNKRYWKYTCIACKYRKSCLKRKYGITTDDYNNMLKEQEGKCKICSNTTNLHSRNNNLDIDHCHITGKVRGLLCNKCNKAIGYFEDNPELIKKALKYLEDSQK